ncbi:MAG TPA: hypothetical protein VK867_01350 [Candidatus Limnocylindrales bacterium]|nr:hypothetical protein [Candidatus Limnocylindrales bacterium]
METRWARRLGPAIAAVAAVAAIASTTAGAPPPIWDPPDCPGSPAVRGRPTGAWFRLDPDLSAGVLIGQRLTLGDAERATEWRMDLDAESFSAGPRGGTVLVGTDDGRSSRLSLIDVVGGCRWPIGTTRDVVRSAVTTPDGAGIVEHRVDRGSRTDLGVWRRAFDGGGSTRLLAPIAADERFGPTWITELAWSEDGGSLVVASCGEVACRYRIVPATGGALTSIADPTLGAMVGVAEGRLIVRGSCRGLPCPLVSREASGVATAVLDPQAGLAVMSRDARGGIVVVYETQGGLQAIRPDGTDARGIAMPPEGLRLVAGVRWSASGADHTPDRLVFGPEGRVPVDGPRTAVLRAVDIDDAVVVGEVLR